MKEKGATGELRTSRAREDAVKMRKLIIDVRMDQKILEINTSRIKKMIQSALVHEKFPGNAAVELSVAFVTDRKIRVLNRRFHGCDRATDVLAFPLDPADGSCDDPGSKRPHVLGDIIVSVERARSFAKLHHEDWPYEVARYVIHGLLHLVGYRDDRAPEAEKMWKRQEELLKKTYKGI